MFALQDADARKFRARSVGLRWGLGKSFHLVSVPYLPLGITFAGLRPLHLEGGVLELSEDRFLSLPFD